LPTIPTECSYQPADLPPGGVVVLSLVDVARSSSGWPVVPAPVRLRRLLKVALRSFGFRCADLRQLPVNRPGAGPSGGALL
jgi:hypothetical protein